MSQRFERDDLITDYLGEDVLDFIENYEQACTDNNLSDNQKLRYFHSLFNE